MRFVLDTGVFFDPAALKEIEGSGAEVIVPAVSFAERLRQLREKPWLAKAFEASLAKAGYEVESFGREQARRLLTLKIPPERWQRLARDALVATHVRMGDRLWTTNARAFLDVGVPEDQIVALPRRH